MSFSYFLEIDLLVDLAITMLAHHMDDIPPLGKAIPEPLVLKLLSRLTPEEQLRFEFRQDFQALGIDTSSLWKERCSEYERQHMISCSWEGERSRCGKSENAKTEFVHCLMEQMQMKKASEHEMLEVLKICDYMVTEHRFMKEIPGRWQLLACFINVLTHSDPQYLFSFANLKVLQVTLISLQEDEYQLSGVFLHLLKYLREHPKCNTLHLTGCTFYNERYIKKCYLLKLAGHLYHYSKMTFSLLIWISPRMIYAMWKIL